MQWRRSGRNGHGDLKEICWWMEQCLFHQVTKPKGRRRVYQDTIWFPSSQEHTSGDLHASLAHLHAPHANHASIFFFFFFFVFSFFIFLLLCYISFRNKQLQNFERLFKPLRNLATHLTVCRKKEDKIFCLLKSFLLCFPFTVCFFGSFHSLLANMEYQMKINPNKYFSKFVLIL